MGPEIWKAIEEFILGENISRKIADEIEVALDDNYPDDDHVQQTVEMLARYRPEGGEFLFDATAIRQRLIETIQYLQKAA